MKNLLSCPFCGGQAEIHETEAISEYATCKKEIPKNARFLRSIKYSSGKIYYEFRRKTYVPRCCKTSCPGRLTKQFKSSEQAVEAWNTRSTQEVSTNV